jgi:hypothetical protein
MTSTDSIIQITILISAKLDRNNFLTWKSYDLFEFLTSNTTAPSPEIILANKNKSNPAFLT